MRYSNLGEMMLEKQKECPNHIAYRFKAEGVWHSVTYGEAVDRIKKLASGLLALGIEAGDRVAIISHNRLEWALIDYATLTIGAVLVPIYPSLLAEQVLYLLNDSRAKVVFVEDDAQKVKVQSIAYKLTNTNDFFIFEERQIDLTDWKLLEVVEKDGAKLLSVQPDIIERRLSIVKPGDVATIIYTSGTTGEPKGAVLTHGNFLANIESAAQIFDIFPSDRLLSFLPLSHVLERMAGHFLATYHSTTIAYAESIDAVPQNILEVKPTIMVSVPRLYEKIYAKILETVEEGSGLKRAIFYWALKTGRKYVQREMYHRPIPTLLKWKRKLAFKLVFAKLHERFGGNIRFFVSGGAPLSPEIATFFAAAGLYILEGYGLTETSPAITMNRLDNYRIGTVGQVLPKEEVKIAEDGEILTRGPHVMMGYYKKPEATKEVIDEQGWFHTGDIGYLDEDGFLVITDRKKNIIVTSGGKNVAPQPIENALISSKYIDQAVVIGDRRKYCTAVLVASEQAVNKWLAQQNLPPKSLPEFNDDANIKQLIRTEVNRLMRSFASYEQIKDFYLAPRPFSQENGDLTPTLKVKRKKVEEKYAAEIDALYRIKTRD